MTSASPVSAQAIRYWKFLRSLAAQMRSMSKVSPLRAQRFVEQSVLGFQRYPNAHGGAFADHGVDLDAAAHELEPLADAEQAEAALAGRQALDAIHLEAHARIDDV